MTQLNTTNAMILSPLAATSQQINALAQPRTVDDVLGAATSEDILSVLRQNVKDNLTQQRNEISARLLKQEQQIAAVRTVYDAMGPEGIKDVDRSAAEEIAGLLTRNGFGKSKVEVEFDGRDEAKKVFSYSLKIIDAHKTDEAYDRTIIERSLTVPFSAEAKKLQRQILDLTKVKQAIEQELMQVKKDFGNIDEHINAARAELGRKRINRLAGGSDLLAQLTRKKAVVAESTGS